MCKILIVEDNVIFRNMTKETLLSRFPTMKIKEETDGNELLSKMESFQPDVVLMDIRLRGKSGLELTKEIKAKYPGIIVILLSGYDLPEYKTAAKESKADHFISKDSPASDFLALIESVCRVKHSEVS